MVNLKAVRRIAHTGLTLSEVELSIAIGSCWRRRQYARLWHAQAQHDTDAL